MRRIWSVFLGVAVVSSFLIPVTRAQTLAYEIQDLIKAHESPEFEVQGIGVYAISPDGVAAGFTGQSETKSSPFYTVDGKPIRVKTGELGSTFSDINSDGVIVGREVTGRNESGSPLGVPAMWVDETITLLEMPASPFGTPFVSGSARSINDGGLIVGDVQFESASFPGEVDQFVIAWQDGVPTILVDAYGFPYCQAFGLTESGLIGGECWSSELAIFRPTVWIDQVPQLLDGPPGAETSIWSATDTADGGYAMTGYVSTVADVLTSVEAVVYTNGIASVLPRVNGTDACRAFSIADTPAGVMIGGFCTETVEAMQGGFVGATAALWLDGELVDLDAVTGNDGEWTFLTVRAVSSQGLIGGLGERNGERRSFILHPTD